MTRPVQSLKTRLWSRVIVGGPDECWPWTGPRSNGYGVIGSGGRGGRTLKAHRVAYEDVVGPIPPGMHIDHLCRVRNCVNPKHLEPVIQAENLRRAGEARTTCTHGHPLPPRPPGKRRPACPTCTHIRYERKKSQS